MLCKASGKRKKFVSAQGIRAQDICVFLPDEFGEVAEAEEEDTYVNCCHQEYTDARADTMQAEVANQQEDRVRHEHKR